MLSRPQCSNSVIGMKGISSAYRNCVDHRIRKHIINRIVCPRAKLLRQRTGSVSREIIETIQLCVRILVIFRNMTNLGYLPASYNTYSEHS